MIYLFPYLISIMFLYASLLCSENTAVFYVRNLQNLVPVGLKFEIAGTIYTVPDDGLIQTEVIGYGQHPFRLIDSIDAQGYRLQNVTQNISVDAVSHQNLFNTVIIIQRMVKFTFLVSKSGNPVSGVELELLKDNNNLFGKNFSTNFDGTLILDLVENSWVVGDTLFVKSSTRTLKGQEVFIVDSPDIFVQFSVLEKERLRGYSFAIIIITLVVLFALYFIYKQRKLVKTISQLKSLNINQQPIIINVGNEYNNTYKPSLRFANESGEVVVEENGTTITIGNNLMSRQFDVSNNRVSTVALINKRTDGGATVFAPGPRSTNFVINSWKNDKKLNIPSSLFTLESKTVVDVPNGKALVFKYQPYGFVWSDMTVNWQVNEIYTMFNDEHFMRKQLEITVPTQNLSDAAIDYIDMESFDINETDFQWSHPQMGGGVGGMSGYLIANGQPIYVQGMFFGLEFPVAESKIEERMGTIRYYSGKVFRNLNDEGRLSNGTFTTWSSVAGASRQLDMDVLLADFHAYINTIVTPSKMRTQYNSWYDWMMEIDENNICGSFKEIERGLNSAGADPLDAYVVDDGWNAYGPYQNENTAGFWMFNSKFPNGLTIPKTLSDKFSSTFGLWLGPRGGYNYNSGFASFLEEHGSGERNPSSADICVGHKTYVKKLQDFFIENQQKYDISYWKLDGWATVQCPRVSDAHITGGFEGMYYMVETWERYAGVFTKMREDAHSRGQDDLWINLTCYVNPSPWFLQWSNSVWMQNSLDIGRINTGLERQVDQLLTYRDDCYYDFVRIRQFQFPLGNLYNHDPIYGKTADLAGKMDDDEFRTYLFMIISRGTLLQNIYYSSTMADEGQKWVLTADVLDWKTKNFHILRHSRLFGGCPSQKQVYGYSSWDGQDGIISLRNPKNEAQSFTFSLDRSMGIPEDATNLYRLSILNFRSVEKDDNSQPFNYGQPITKRFEAGEAVIWQFSPTKDVSVPKVEFVKSPTSTILNIRFTKRVDISQAVFKLDGVQMTAELKADYRLVSLTVPTMIAEKSYKVQISSLYDHNGNTTDINLGFTYYSNQQICKMTDANDLSSVVPFENDLTFKTQVAVLNQKQVSLKSKLGVVGTADFNVSFIINTISTGIVLQQDEQIIITIESSGKVVFQLKGSDLKTVSTIIVNDGISRLISVNRERNGMLKIYINGQLDNSAFIKGRATEIISSSQISIGSSKFIGKIGAVSVVDRALNFHENEEQYKQLASNSVPYFGIKRALIFI